MTQKKSKPTEAATPVEHPRVIKFCVSDEERRSLGIAAAIQCLSVSRLVRTIVLERAMAIIQEDRGR